VEATAQWRIDAVISHVVLEVCMPLESATADLPAIDDHPMDS
jgi:hypothetical protein